MIWVDISHSLSTNRFRDYTRLAWIPWVPSLTSMAGLKASTAPVVVGFGGVVLELQHTTFRRLPHGLTGAKEPAFSPSDVR